MFTGIIEKLGNVKAVKKGAASSILTIDFQDGFEDVKLGDSIATNGVCLTVKHLGNGYFEADVMAESLRRSNLGELRPGSKVNLERAMPADGRFGGHMVSGHIDGTGTIKKIEAEDKAVWFTIQAADEVLKYIVEKGSVAIDGISLTVACVNQNSFQVSIIPHTIKHTILSGKSTGDTVNLECDMVGKYIEKLLGYKREKECKSKVSLDLLNQNGFL